MANTLRFKRGLASGIPTGVAGEPLFTTDTFDLYIGNGTSNTRFQKYIASGTTSQLLRGDGSLLTMPIVLTSPATGQVLKFNGTNWVNDSDSGITGSGTTNYLPKFTGATTLGNSLITDNGTSVGIGNASASIELSVYSATTSRIHVQNSTSGINPNDGLQLAISGANGFLWNFENGDIRFGTNGTERGRFTALGNLHLGTFTSDSGQRLQVTGTALISDSLRVDGVMAQGGVTSNDINFYMRKGLSGSVYPAGIYMGSVISSTSTSGATMFISDASTQAASFTLPRLEHFKARQGAIGASSSISNQYGFFVESTLNGATNNYGFFGDIASGTGRWNLYMNGTANNYMAGNLLIGTTSNSDGYKINATGTQIFSNHGFRLGTGYSAIDVATGVGGLYLSGAQGALNHIFIHSSGNTLLGSTTNSGEKLQVNGTAKITGATTAASFIPSGSSVPTNGMYLNGTNSLAFSTNSTFRFVIGSTGTLGIGIPNPSLGYGDGVGVELSPIGYIQSYRSQAVSATFGRHTTTGSIQTFFYGATAGTAGQVGAIGTDGDGLTFSGGAFGTTHLTLTSGGNLGLAVTPSAWGTTNNTRALQMNAGTMWTFGSSSYFVGQNYFFNGSNRIYYATAAATEYAQISGSHIWYNAPSGTAGNAITFTQAMTLDASGNLLVGSATSSGERLQVTGTAKITDSATFSKAYSNTSDLGIIVTAGIPGINLRSTSQGRTTLIQNYHQNATMSILGGTGTNNPTTTIATFNGSDGSVSLGGYTLSTGELLQVNGTAKITGASTFNSFITVTRNQDANVTTFNATAGVTPVSVFVINTDQPNSRSVLMARNGYSLALGTQDANRLTIDTTGAATFSSTIAVGGTATFLNPSSVNIVGTATLVGATARNTSSASGNTQCGFYLENGTSNGQLYKAGTGYTTLKTIAANDLGFYNAAAGNISILNDFASGSIILTAGGSSTAQWTIGANGDLTAADGENIIVGSTNGTKIGTAATQKIGFWNATPIVQPNNSVAAANYVSGIGSAVTTLDAFDGYTIGQVVKALRNAGILS